MQSRPRRAQPATAKTIALRVIILHLVVALSCGVTWAYWTAGSVPGSAGRATAATVNGGATPSVSAVGSSVTVTWAASTLSNGTAVSGYIVKRYDASHAAQTILSNCTGMVVATTCTENAVPAGNWVYSVTPAFATNWRGTESTSSNAIWVDSTPPVNGITVSVGSGNAYKTGNTVYYRGVAAGSLTLVNAVTDSGSGPASSATAALGGTATGWTHTPSTSSTPAGGPYTSNAFSWTAGATSAPTDVVTGRDILGNAVTTTLTFTNDSTGPTPGSVTYSAGYQAGLAVAVTFASGTDGGSGIATRQLQRSSAPLTAGSCGAFNSFIDIGPNNPVSPYADTQVFNSVCYKYRFVVTDFVGNPTTVASATVANVDYGGAVNATAGLLSRWRLGESTISADAFTSASVTPLVGHSGEIGATWVQQAGNSPELISTASGAFRNTTGYSISYTTALPPSADYNVEADVVVKTHISGRDQVGVIGRMNTLTNSFYMARWDSSRSTWRLVEMTSGTAVTLVESTPTTVTDGVSYRLRLNMVGTALKLYVDGVLMASATDATISAAGQAGVMDGSGMTSPAKSASTGLHLDNFRVTPRAADGKGTNVGDYYGATLGVPGVLVGDPNTAAQFDGVDDYVQMVSPSGIPVLGTVRSVEMWFKTSSSARQVLYAYGTGVANQEFGLFLNGGSSVTAWGWPAANDKTFALTPPVNDGQWHHVVETYNGTVITIYVDGVALPTQAATRSTVMDPYGFVIGAAIRPADTGYTGGYFNGSLDEVALYTTALNQTNVTDHFQLGKSAAPDFSGPTGGSVDAIGLVGTGSRYAVSTILSLALNKGTDPSGVATIGAQLLRATATLTSAGGTADGVCGTFGTYTLITGGADPVSPMSDTVVDQACYSYRYIVSDSLGNPTTYTSPAIKVDTTGPGAPSLIFSGFTNTYWATGTTAYYRSAATSGSITVTASSTDASSGIAAYGYPALGTNWTSTPGALGVNTYSWAAAPAAPGGRNVTASNNAAITSANSPFTLTADDTSPSAGSLTYLDGFTTGSSISVTFTTGTDSGSGVGTRLLQRASATLTGSTCGTFAAFLTLAAGTNPTSPLVDAINRGNCYKYQYIVPDNLGNLTTTTSGNVIKVLPTYPSTILGTAGLLSYWRLGETTMSSDTFTGTAGATLQSRSGEVGATWTKHAISPGDAVITPTGRIRKNGTVSAGLYYVSAVPPTADYTVEADVFVASSLANDLVGVMGRLDTASANGTFYAAVYDRLARTWTLYSVVNGFQVSLGQSTVAALTDGATYHLALDMTGSKIRMLVDGTQLVSVTNADITAAGRAGVALGSGAANTTVTDTTGMHLDNFRVSPPAADSKGSNSGDYLVGPTLGVTGAILTDSNTAVQFDGVDDFGTVARQISTDFSIELWFKSTQGIGTATTWSSGAGLVDADVAGSANDFGVSLRSDGKVVAGVGGGTDSSIVSTTSGYNNGAWHHVVFTRLASSGALRLYVDGVVAGSATGSTVALTSPANITFGRLQSGVNYLAGSMDEIAVYTTVLSQSTVTEHYSAGV